MLKNTFNLSYKSVLIQFRKNSSNFTCPSLWPPANMEAFKDISDEYNISIIGDAAQAHGASIGKDKVGTLLVIECFSFYLLKT